MPEKLLKQIERILLCIDRDDERIVSVQVYHIRAEDIAEL